MVIYMKHWQIFMAIIVFILLYNVKVKEGNEERRFSIPAQAEVYNTPIELIDKMKDIIDDKQTNDMVENTNLKYDISQTQQYLNDARNTLKTDNNTLKTCNASLKNLINILCYILSNFLLKSLKNI